GRAAPADPDRALRSDRRRRRRDGGRGAHGRAARMEPADGDAGRGGICRRPRRGAPPMAVKRATRRLNVAREGGAARRTRAGAIARGLARAYPDADCELVYHSPWELLVATILSAQCTDKMVNQVTPTLFGAYPTPQALADAPPDRIEALI